MPHFLGGARGGRCPPYLAPTLTPPILSILPHVIFWGVLSHFLGGSCGGRCPPYLAL